MSKARKREAPHVVRCDGEVIGSWPDAGEALWEAYEASVEANGEPASVYCDGFVMATVTAVD